MSVKGIKNPSSKVTNRLEVLRLSQGLTRQELGRRTEINSRTIARLEEEYSKPRPHVAKALMDYFRCDLEEIFDFTGRWDEKDAA